MNRLIHLTLVDVDDDFMAIFEDNEDNDDKLQKTSNIIAATSAESNRANSTCSSCENFQWYKISRPMVSSCIRDRPESNNLDKILTDDDDDDDQRFLIGFQHRI